MTFTNAGKNRVRDLVDADLNHGQLGSGTATPTYADTALSSATTGTSTAITTQTSDKQIVVDYSLPSTSAQGSTMSEFGLFNSSNTMFARFVFASLTHSSTEEWQFSTRLFID